jgi:hypothetical protein
MPYIKQERRDAMTPTLKPFPDTAKNCGELNYAITLLLIKYWEEKGASYQTINDIHGAASGALHEFQRRVVGKYEDQKIKENGDVYA